MVETHKFRRMGLPFDQAVYRAHRNENKYLEDELQKYRNSAYLAKRRVEKIKRQLEEKNLQGKSVSEPNSGNVGV